MATPTFIIIDGKKTPVRDFTIEVNGRDLLKPDGEVRHWTMLLDGVVYIDFECEPLPNPDDPYGTRWHALLFWLCGAMYYPWLFRN